MVGVWKKKSDGPLFYVKIVTEERQVRKISTFQSQLSSASWLVASLIPVSPSIEPSNTAHLRSTAPVARATFRITSNGHLFVLRRPLHAGSGWKKACSQAAQITFLASPSANTLTPPLCSKSTFVRL